MQADGEAGDSGRRISEYIDHQNNRILIAQRLQASLNPLLCLHIAKIVGRSMHTCLPVVHKVCMCPIMLSAAMQTTCNAGR